MPLNDVNLFGTEKDGSKNYDYCKFCFKDGAFTHPRLTLEQMKLHMMQIMDAENLPQDALEAAISRLPQLKRWKVETN